MRVASRSAILVALLLSLTANAQAMYRVNQQTTAPDRVGQLDWGLGAAASMNNETDDSYLISTTAAYGVTPYIAIGVEAGWQEAEGGSTNETVGYVPVMADILIRFPNIHEALVPYAVLGLGAAGVYVERDNRDDVDDTSFAWKLGAGLDYFLDPQWIFNVEFAYWSVDTSLPNTSVGVGGTSFWTLGAAIKYLF